MKKSILFICAAVFLTSCGVSETSLNSSVELGTQEAATEQKIIAVTASIIPIGSVVNAVGGEYVEVNTIIPAGVSPHGFDLSPRDLIAIENSEISFLIGLEQIDGFLEKVLQDTKYLELAEGMELIEVAAHDHDTHHDEHGDEHADDHGHSEEREQVEYSIDPHVWLGKENIFTISTKIRDELSTILPEKSEYFAENTTNFQTEIEALYQDFIEKNSEKSPKEFIVFHDAYNYMMESLKIDTDLKVAFSENVLHESGTAHMTEIIDEIELHGIKNIFREPQFTGGALQKFTDEYDLILGTLDPLGSDDSAAGYTENLRANLDNISKIYE